MIIRLKLIIEYGNALFDLILLVFTGPIHYRNSSILVQLLILFNILMLPVQILVNTVMLLIWYLPFSPMRGLKAIHKLHYMIFVERLGRRQLRKCTK